MRTDLRRGLQHGMRAKRADAHRAILRFDRGEPGQAGDVDQQLGRRKSQVERGNEALAARENAGTGTLEKLQRLRERARLRVGKRRRLQARPSSSGPFSVRKKG